jgi:hypothetical protein
MPIPARRPWGLIVVVLVIDIALAAAGAWMLSQGLSDKGAAPPRSGASATPSSSVADHAVSPAGATTAAVDASPHPPESS